MPQAKKLLRFLTVTIAWLGIWQILSAVAGLNVLLPSPLTTLKALGGLVVTLTFWKSIAFSIIRIVTGFILGTLIGTAFAVISGISSIWDSMLKPVIHIIKATPVASFIVLAIVWLDTGNVPSFTSMLMVMPIVWTNIRTGIKETDSDIIEMAQSFNVKKSAIVKKIYYPSVKPYLISAMTTGMGLAWKAGIAAEVICNPVFSIGSGIYDAKIYLETPELFAWTAVVIIISIMLEKLMLTILKRGKSDD